MSAAEEPSGTVLWECRLHFLRAAAANPTIRLADALREQVFEPSRRAWAELGLPMPQKPASEWTHEQFLALARYGNEQARLIENWAKSLNLNFEWVHSAARDALVYAVFPRHPFAIIPGYEPPEFFWERWYYEYEGETKYRKRARASFMRALNDYIREVRRLRKRFLPDRGARAAHYRWAVEHVCLKRGWTGIANKHEEKAVDPQAVREAVLTILDRIGIPGSQAKD